jgi:TetR/AcrR family transcriptional repressor of nem operon
MAVEALMARPKEFDPDEAVDRAIEYFSRQTYRGTTVRDPARHMGISSSSFYNAFGDKRRVYLLALARYVTRLQVGQSRLYSETDASVDGLRQVLHRAVDGYLAVPQQGDWGMFAVNATFETILYEPEVRALLVANHQAFRSILEGFFTRCQSAGTVSLRRSPRALARFMVGVISSLTTLARLDPDREVLEDMIAVALDVLVEQAGPKLGPDRGSR